MQPLSEAEKIQGWMNTIELEWLREKAMQVRRGGVVVAAGVWRGRSVVAMAVDHVFLMCVDHFQGSPGDPTLELAAREDIHGAFVANMDRLGIDPHLIVADAIETAALFADEAISFLFMDCDDADFDRLFHAWYPKIAPGGVFSGHDYSPEFPNIQNTINSSGLDHWLVGGTSIWVIYKYYWL